MSFVKYKTNNLFEIFFMPKLSAVIITFNEERNIARCLDSLAGVADEIVVIDSFSTDMTEKICRDRGARFIQNTFAGHIEQKNFALTQAVFPHVLSLDADEALSENLRAAILALKKDWRCDGYAMNRLNNYCGQWIRHCGWYPDRKVRLFDTRKARWGGTNPHDRVELQTGATQGFLAGDLLHYSYYTPEEHLARVRQYGDIGAKALFEQGQKASLAQVFLSPLFKFLRNYILKRGFLDGQAGWRICYGAALETAQKYGRLRAMHR